ncbi:MAG: biotin--[acetyl-CoA-carboxylase] ligase, partial [Anaerovorax sp.]
EVINQVMAVTNELTSRSFIKEYRERSIVIGKQINVIKNGIPSPGKALYIDADGALIVQFDGGGIHTLNSGEISIRLAE